MLRIGVVGCGYWGPNLVRNFMELPEFEMAVVCDLLEDRLGTIRAKYPSLSTTTRAEEVLEDPTLDAVAISTPISTHFALAKGALEAGKHVFVEKPITNRVNEAEILCEEPHPRGLTLMVDKTF